MEDIELSNQSSRRSAGRNGETQEKHDDDMTAASSHHSQSSMMPEESTKQKPKQSVNILSKLLPLPLLRIIVKAAVSTLIALLFVFEDNCRNAVGSASILVPIGTLLYFPVRPIGVQIEAALQGTFSALLGSAWCFLGMYLASIARDPAVISPVQPASSAILAIFMFIGVFGLTYVRTKFAQANFATIFASIIVAFCLTQASIVRIFSTTLIYTFLKPLAVATAIGLLVDIFLWPEDSITKYMGLMSRSLKEYNGFFEEHVTAFLSADITSSKATSLPTLHQSLQNSILQLIDSKREIQREILFNRLAHKDINDITRHIKLMRVPLHGIGLGLIAKLNRLSNIEHDKILQNEHKKQFIEDLKEAQESTQQLADVCVTTLNECIERLMRFSGKPRSTKSTLLWPFPRIFVSDYRKSSKEQQEEKDEQAKIQKTADRLHQAIAHFEAETRKPSRVFIDPGSNQYEIEFNSILQVVYLFQYNLREHALHLQSFLQCIETIETKRTNRKLRFPKLPLRKWFRSISVDANLGGQVDSPTDHTKVGASQTTNDLTLCQTRTQNELVDTNEGLVRQKKATYPRDPDVNPPETASEKFFYSLYRGVEWAKSPDCAFSFKTAAGFVLISLPAFLPQSATWFFAWRGQWATITLMMWMIPVTGMFVFSVILRVIGTVLGGVLGIIVWEIARGNPYGLVVLTFFVMMPLYYVFFTSQILKMVAIMTQLTLLLVVCYEYQYVVSGAPTYDSVEVVAGKRMLLVIIGVAGAAILALIPKPVTGRVELRKRISRTIKDLGQLYSILVGDILAGTEPTDNQRKAFRKLALGIRRQIADEQTYLKLAKLEPPLRGKFPLETYATLVQKVDNMADLLQGMAYSSRNIDKSWRRNIVEVTRQERKELIANSLSIMKLLSATLASKMALPPYMSPPVEMRAKFIQKMSEVISKYPNHLDNDTFPNYCAFGVNAYMFLGELSETLECVEKLVGIEDPDQWLLLHA